MKCEIPAGARQRLTSAEKRKEYAQRKGRQLIPILRKALVCGAWSRGDVNVYCSYAGGLAVSICRPRKRDEVVFHYVLDKTTTLHYRQSWVDTLAIMAEEAPKKQKVAKAATVGVLAKAQGIESRYSVCK